MQSLAQEVEFPWHILNRTYLSPLVTGEFATPLSHLAEIVQEVQQSWKRKGNACAHPSLIS